MPVCKRSLIRTVVAGVIAKVMHYAYFDGVNNYVAFSEFEIIPEGEPGFISFEGAFEKSDMWITTLKDSSVGNESKRVLFYDQKLYIGYTVAANFTEENYAKISDGNYRRIKVARSVNDYWSVQLDGVEITTTSSPESMSIRADSFGSRYAGGTSVPYLQGIAANVNLNNKRLYKLNEAWSLYPVANDSLNDSGPELEQFSKEIYEVTTSSYAWFAACDIAEAGKFYLVEFDYQTTDIARVGVNGTLEIFNGTGHFKKVIKAGTEYTSVYFQPAQTSETDIRVENISVKETTSGIYMNFQKEDVRRRLL